MKPSLEPDINILSSFPLTLLIYDICIIDVIGSLCPTNLYYAVSDIKSYTTIYVSSLAETI
jgi:hypothetical protein